MTLEEKVDKILENHLPHLSDRIANLEGKVAVILAVVAVSLLGITGNIVISLIK